MVNYPDFKLSASTYKAYKDCPRKIAHKLAKSPKDAAAEGSFASRDFGTLVHHFLEAKALDIKRPLPSIIEITTAATTLDLVTAFSIQELYSLLFTLHNGYDLLEEQIVIKGKRVYGVELPVETEKTQGYIDLILEDPVTNWLTIYDYKTANSFNYPIDHYIEDPQVLHYLSMFPERDVNFEIIQFLKVKNVVKANETTKEYIERMTNYSYGGKLRKSVRIQHIYHPKSYLEAFAGIFRQTADLIREMPCNPMETEGNEEYCVHPVYKSKCEYFETCKGYKVNDPALTFEYSK